MINRIFVAATFVICLMAYGCSKKTGAYDPEKPVKTEVNPTAIAPADTTIQLPVNSVVLKGAGTKGSGATISYLWKEVSGPGTATLVNDSSATVTAKGLVAGVYAFQLKVTNDFGLSGLDTVNVTVTPTKTLTTDTLTLQPNANPTESVLGLLGTDDYSSTGTVEEPLAAWTINAVPVTVRTLLKFDLSSIPSSAIILSADIIMFSDTIPLNGDLIHANYGVDNSFTVQQVATAWDPLNLNWFNQPAGLNANQVTVPNTDQPYLTTDINVKDMVSAMVSNNTNYGFKLTLAHEDIYTSRIFCSSYYSDASRHPKIIIIYKH